MKVGIRSAKDKDSFVGEMNVDEPEVGFIFEMTTDPAKLSSFGFPEAVVGAARAVAEANEDAKPEFPVLRVEEGWSDSGRLWDGETIDSIAEQTNRLQPVAHLGHIKDEDAPTKMPDPQTTWLGAVTKMEPSRQKDRKGEMVKAIYLAGYNLPGARVRTYIKSKAVRGISWWGKARQIPIPGKGVRVSNFKLLAIDWARKGSEGMPSSRIVALAKEMKEDTLDKELSQVTPEEFEKENPNGYALLVSKATAEKDKIIGEMEAKVKEGEEDKKLLDEIRKSLKIDADADPLEKIATLMQKLGVKAKEAVDKALDSILEERIKDEKTRGIVKRMMPVAEMESKAADAKDKEEVEKIVKEMTDASFNEDEIVKEMVSEESAPVVRRREEFMRGSGDTDKALKDSGMERERVTL